MEKKIASASVISKKLILEYIFASIIFGIMSCIFIKVPISFIENDILKIILQTISYTILTFLYIWAASRNVLPLYVIRKEDINKIIRNVCIFFVVMIVIDFITNYDSYQKLIQTEAQRYSISIEYDENDIADEIIKASQNNGSYADVYNNLREKQEEKFKKEFYQKYGYLILIPTIYDVAIYGIMIFLQRKWLLKAAE